MFVDLWSYIAVNKKGVLFGRCYLLVLLLRHSTYTRLLIAAIYQYHTTLPSKRHLTKTQKPLTLDQPNLGLNCPETPETPETRQVSPK